MISTDPLTGAQDPNQAPVMQITSNYKDIVTILRMIITITITITIVYTALIVYDNHNDNDNNDNTKPPAAGLVGLWGNT